LSVPTFLASKTIFKYIPGIKTCHKNPISSKILT
jgi:hypothetical protein